MISVVFSHPRSRKIITIYYGPGNHRYCLQTMFVDHGLDHDTLGDHDLGRVDPNLPIYWVRPTLIISVYKNRNLLRFRHSKSPAQIM